MDKEQNNKTYAIHKNKLDGYQMQGFLLKKVSEDIKESVAGVLEGIVVETYEDGEVFVFKLDDSVEDKVSLKPWMRWKEGVFSELKGRKLSAEPCVPPGKSKGVFVMKTGRIAVPLMC